MDKEQQSVGSSKKPKLTYRQLREEKTKSLKYKPPSRRTVFRKAKAKRAQEIDQFRGVSNEQADLTDDDAVELHVPTVDDIILITDITMDTEESIVIPDSDDEPEPEPLFDKEETDEDFFDALDLEMPVEEFYEEEDFEIPSKWNKDICNELGRIFRQHNVSHVLMREFLKFIRVTLKREDVPLSPIVVLGREKIIEKVEQIAGGEFVYLGITKGLNNLLKHCTELRSMNTIEIDFSWDGIPVFKASSKSLWPICAAISNTRLSPFPIAMFLGVGTKPTRSDEFFNKFVNELEYLESNGFQSDEYGLKEIKRGPMIADTPARQVATGSAGHCAKDGCNFCNQFGTYLKHRVVFSDTEGEERNDKSFRERRDPDYHKYDKFFS